MTDVSYDSTVFRLVSADGFVRLRHEGLVSSGMIPKLQNALDSAAAGVEEVRICRAEDLLGTGGTVIRYDSDEAAAL
ncbi:MAG: hypothetical protein K2N19_06615, partial [Muribaculaceae bacterium]|nr:hypothetical protein [Muribaculaceae bacterium]